MPVDSGAIASQIGFDLGGGTFEGEERREMDDDRLRSVRERQLERLVDVVRAEGRDEDAAMGTVQALAAAAAPIAAHLNGMPMDPEVLIALANAVLAGLRAEVERWRARN